MLLPENKPTTFDKTPTKFFVWGASMTGKTYFARQFPNPILLNTDGNAAKVDTPSVDITSFEQFINILNEIEEGKHTFETVIIDLVDDIELLMINSICEKFKVDSLADIPYGVGYAKANKLWKDLMMHLSKSKYNIIFISHIIEKLENDKTIQVPSLPAKSLNACLGRCDLQIQTLKLGNTYNKVITSKRDTYVPTDIKNPRTLEILKPIIGLFTKPTIIQNNINNK